MKWQPIEELDIVKGDRTMFVVKSFGYVFPNTGVIYTSDPYCVWKEGDSFVRWPHYFSPTHFCMLPENVQMPLGSV